MRKTFLLALLIPVILFISCLVAAEENATQLAQAVIGETAIGGTGVMPVAGGMQGRVSLDLRDIDIVDALKFLAVKAGVNMVTTQKVTGRVTLVVEGVVIKDIFDIMLRSSELAYMKQGDIYNVMTESEYKALFGKKFADIRQVKTVRLKYAVPEHAFALMDTLKSDIGRILEASESGTILIMDTPESIRKIEEALATLEERSVVRVFKLKYAMAKNVEEQLKARLDAKKVGSIKADERSNLVIVQALPDRMKEIETLIAALDAKTKQVLIDTTIVKVKLTDDADRNIEWEGLMSLAASYGQMMYFGSYPFSAVQAATDAWRSRKEVLDALGGAGSYPFGGTTSDYIDSTTRRLMAPGERMHVGIVSGQKDLDVFIKFLQTVGNTQILSNPKLAVVNNQEASLHVGERQAYVTTTTTTGQTTTTVSEEVTFVDVGIQLSVTPTINDDGYIQMHLKPEISSVTSYLITPTENEIPIIDTSTAETTVLVKDGSTIIIGGLRKEEKTESTEQVPFLGKIPLIGFLFNSSSKGSDRTELLIMITPHIISGDLLTTGDERDLGYKPGKDYEDYRSFTDETDFTLPEETPEEMIKPYREYERGEEGYFRDE